MIQIVSDLHLHSRYSRAVSPQMVLPVMANVAKQKGLQLLATGDWTHPVWFKELREQLEEAEEGVFKIRNNPIIKYPNNRIIQNTTQKEIPDQATRSTFSVWNDVDFGGVRFLLSVEISCIYSQNGKGRRIHNLVFVPSFSSAEKINKALLQRGYSLSSDGRPIIGMSSKQLLQTILEIDDKSLLIPAHVWTPWFGIYGEKSGFNSLEECFEDLAPYVYGIETGISSDPEMNWQIKDLQSRSILSFSDAHSPAKMGREATVFELESLSYENIRKAIMRPAKTCHPHEGEDLSAEIRDSRLRGNDEFIEIDSSAMSQNDNKVLYTVEFYPEEGKYHYSGHRACGVILKPDEQRAVNNICPVCGKKLTDGVMRRVQELATQDSRYKIQDSRGLLWFTDPRGIHPPFVKIVPLNEIIAEAIGRPVSSPKVAAMFDILCNSLQSEFNVLLHASIEDIAKFSNSKIAEGIRRVRAGLIEVQPGYDGVYGIVSIFPKEEKGKKQLGLELQ